MTYVHVDFSREERPRRRVHEEDALEKIEGGDNQKVILSI